ncbi:MAG: hypothetical protein RLZZ383_398 [Pseudomonadota bacterium]
MEIRDPIHGAIEFDAAESALLHQPFLQRLRRVKQVGFSHVPFPGATHSRFAHVVGVAHLAGQAFDRAYRDWVFDAPDARRRFRAAVRLAALCHDLGHAPFSHCTEFAMPPVGELALPWYRHAPASRSATHEDYTIAILAHTALGEAIPRDFPCTARHVAALIDHDVAVDDDFFLDSGFDHRRLLSQLISSELDADRLDYLQRDAYFTGAKYGTIDVPWILSHLSAHVADGGVALALDKAAIFAFDDFLVSRHHMFLQVYFHHTSVIYEEMLRAHVADLGGAWQISADLDRYLWLDDIALEAELRGSDGRWARRIVEARPFRRVVERHGGGSLVRVERERRALERAGIEVIETASDARLSRYALGPGRATAAPIWVHERQPGTRSVRTERLTDASAVFDRYAGSHRIARLYVAPEAREAAIAVLAGVDGPSA